MLGVINRTIQYKRGNAQPLQNAGSSAAGVQYGGMVSTLCQGQGTAGEDTAKVYANDT